MLLVLEDPDAGLKGALEGPRAGQKTHEVVWRADHACAAGAVRWTGGLDLLRVEAAVAGERLKASAGDF